MNRSPNVRSSGFASLPRTGFTMLEVIVAIAIGAVLMGVLYQLFYAGSRINRDTMTKADALQAATLTLATVQQDLKQLVTLPVAKKPSGEVDNRFGDHQVPVRVSPLRRNIAFYVPDKSAKRGELPSPGAVAVSYSLEPAEVGGLFRVRRSEAGASKDDNSTRVLTAVNVKDLKFRLLDPKATDPADRSPDQSYYVEAVVTGSDATGRETMTMSALTQLEYPSTFQQPQNRNVNETLVFTPRAPL
ncbi:MAG: prepilin-type N-terminal cleavage/methylation domain-containing protein, partial [Candidatus Riflebacteria bacterium]|nr:prepilin-type N-terminal cleavage/methylation domain-containing protein [Candidatus Riflebacteria bacterium]